MNPLQPVRGTHDLLPEEARKHRFIGDLACELAALYGYEEIATPIFEFSEVFTRTLGESSDIVTKERYNFQTPGGEELTLRPEGTAGIARAVISHGMYQNLPLRFFYCGPMFRHERPQKGRQRQFHQLGCELIGVAGWQGDLELLTLAHHFLTKLDLRQLTELQINTLGDPQSRADYRSALVDYFSRFENELSGDSKIRLKKNPLRILDSKDPNDRKLVAGAPTFADYLNAESKVHFDSVIASLEQLGISYVINPRLVRGLDYYGHTVFEFVTTTLGSQDAVLSGGRYDELITQMGGTPTPGVGWAAGIERLSMMLAKVQPKVRPVSLIALGDRAQTKCLQLAYALREQGFAVDVPYTGNLQKRMKRASRVSAWAAFILGDDELDRGEITFKLMDTGDQKSILFDEILATLQSVADRSRTS